MRVLRALGDSARFARFQKLTAPLPFLLLFFSSTAENVNYRENDDPDRVDEVPVHGKHANAARLILIYPAGQTKKKDDQKHEQSSGDMECVKTDERVIGRSKQVRGDRQAF